MLSLSEPSIENSLSMIFGFFWKGKQDFDVEERSYSKGTVNGIEFQATKETFGFSKDKSRLIAQIYGLDHHLLEQKLNFQSPYQSSITCPFVICSRKLARHIKLNVIANTHKGPIEVSVTIDTLPNFKEGNFYKILILNKDNKFFANFIKVDSLELLEKTNRMNEIPALLQKHTKAKEKKIALLDKIKFEPNCNTRASLYTQIGKINEKKSDIFSAILFADPKTAELIVT